MQIRLQIWKTIRLICKWSRLTPTWWSRRPCTTFHTGVVEKFRRVILIIISSMAKAIASNLRSIATANQIEKSLNQLSRTFWSRQSGHSPIFRHPKSPKSPPRALKIDRCFDRRAMLPELSMRQESERMVAQLCPALGLLSDEVVVLPLTLYRIWHQVVKTSLWRLDQLWVDQSSLAAKLICLQANLVIVLFIVCHQACMVTKTLIKPFRVYRNKYKSFRNHCK